MITALSIIHVIVMCCLSIAFLIDWLQSFSAIRKYLKYGILAGLIVVGLDLLIVAITPSSWGPELYMGIMFEPIIFLKQMGFTMLGMYYLAVSGYPSFPVLLRKFGIASDESKADENTVDNRADTRTATKDSMQSGNPIPYETTAQIPVSNEELPASDILLDIDWKAYFLTIFGVIIAGILYSIVLFRLTTPHVSEMLQKTVGSPSGGSGDAMNLQIVLLVLEFAVAEELIFRLGIQSYLVRYLKLQGQRYWIAILITSVLWTLGHAGELDPAWVKLAQIFPVGLLLGWLFRKYGAESTIIAHGLFNVVLVFLSPYLLT